MTLVLKKVELKNEFNSVSAYSNSSDITIICEGFSLYYITVTSHERHGVWNHRHLECLFNSLFSIMTGQTAAKSSIMVDSHHKGTSFNAICVSHLNHYWCSRSSGWLSAGWYLIWMSYDANQRQPDDITKFWVNHPNDLARGDNSSGWLGIIAVCHPNDISDSKVHGAHMGPIWGRQDPGGLHAGPMNLAIWDMKAPSVIRMTYRHLNLKSPEWCPDDVSSRWLWPIQYVNRMT